MFTYFIAGVPKRPDFGHIKVVVEKLKRSLPHFSYEILVKTEDEYQNWLQEFCDRQKWKINKNPIVWKRTTASNDHCHLIGGISEFFELLAEYYNIDTRLNKRIKKLIALDNEERMSLVSVGRTAMCRPAAARAPRIVCVTGAVYPSTGHLVLELMQLDRLRAEDGGGVTIRLHNNDANEYEDLIKLKNKMMNMLEVHGSVIVVESVEEGLLNCDLLIVIGSLKKERNEDNRLWTYRNYDAMRHLASKLNRHCPRKCKVLMMDMDLLCFNLSVLAEFADKVYLYNVIGVTGHYGMETLPTISRTSGVPISDLHCPPVWGFVGTEKYIDVDSVVYGHRCRRSAVNRNGDKYLRTALLQSSSAAGDLQDLVNGKTNENNPVKTDCPLSRLPEVRATIRLLTEWYENKSCTTISAAVFSDGTFGLPFGMFMSQPVCIENGEWKPNYDFPSPDEKILKEIVSKAMDITIKYNLGNRFKTYSRESMLQIPK